MSRALWFAAGAGAGIYGMVRGRRAAEALTVEGLHDRVAALTLGMRMFRDEVAHGAAERETELRARFGVLPHERPTIPELHGSETGASAPVSTTDQEGN